MKRATDSSSSSYTFIREKDRHLFEITWPSRKSLTWFKFSIRQAFGIEEGSTFLLMDELGHICVLSRGLPGGSYGLVEAPCVETIQALASRHDHHQSTVVRMPDATTTYDDDRDDSDDNDDDKESRGDEPYLRGKLSKTAGGGGAVTGGKSVGGETFELSLLQLACADAMIANERTFLAWTRTSLCTPSRVSQRNI